MKYRLMRSARRSLSVEITENGDIVVRAPFRLPEAEIEDFLCSRRGWIEKHIAARREAAAGAEATCLTEAELESLAKAAGARLPPLVARRAARIGVDFERISLRLMKTRWGSCSARGHLTFNILLMLAPEEVLDYVIVHELCHRRHMDHSPAFWAEVARWCPDYRAGRRWLRENGSVLMFAAFRGAVRRAEH